MKAKSDYRDLVDAFAAIVEDHIERDGSPRDMVAALCATMSLVIAQMPPGAEEDILTCLEPAVPKIMDVALTARDAGDGEAAVH